MTTPPRSAHGPSSGNKSGHVAVDEPEFDAERVIWDSDYRREVMESLRQWQAHHTVQRARTATAALNP